MSSEQSRDKVKGSCPSCGSDRWAIVLGQKQLNWSDDDAGVWTADTHRLLECAGCSCVYYQHVHQFSENTDYDLHGNEHLVPTVEHFPAVSKRAKPEWLWQLNMSSTIHLTEVFGSLYTAIDNGLLVLAASGARTVFEMTTDHLGIDPAKTFEEKIEDLREQGRIGSYEQSDLTAMVAAANSAMHRGWKPSLEELDTMFTTLERFVHHTFVHGGKGEKLKEKLPPRPTRKKTSA